MDGTVLEITVDDLGQAVAAYRPDRHEAPLVVGHPRHDAPAWGWVNALRLVDGELHIIPRQVDPVFAELVSTGRYKKISASFYTPRSPNNPVPGVYYLRHVGFLGAQSPAVKGLPDASFEERESGVVLLENTFSFSGAGKLETRPPEPTQSSTTTMEHDMSEKQQALASKEAELNKKERELNGREARFQERESKLNEELQEVQRRQSIEFVDRLIREGRLLPRHREGVLAFMACLDSGSEVAFSEGEGDEAGGAAGETMSAQAFFKRFLSELPVHVDYGEQSGEGGEAAPETIHFAAPNGYAVDPAGLTIHRKILAYARANSTDYITAALAVSG